MFPLEKLVKGFKMFHLLCLEKGLGFTMFHPLCLKKGPCFTMGTNFLA
jgi:hypothetical protein